MNRVDKLADRDGTAKDLAPARGTRGTVDWSATTFEPMLCTAIRSLHGARTPGAADRAGVSAVAHSSRADARRSGRSRSGASRFPDTEAVAGRGRTARSARARLSATLTETSRRSAASAVAAGLAVGPKGTGQGGTERTSGGAIERGADHRFVAASGRPSPAPTTGISAGSQAGSAQSRSGRTTTGKADRIVSEPVTTIGSGGPV